MDADRSESVHNFVQPVAKSLWSQVIDGVIFCRFLGCDEAVGHTDEEFYRHFLQEHRHTAKGLFTGGLAAAGIAFLLHRRHERGRS